MVYTPDVWVILEIKTPERTVYKVLAGWYGGYTQGDSWQANSGIVRVTRSKYRYLFEGYSGSVYSCSMGTEAFSGLTQQVYERFKKGVENLDDGSSVKRISMKTYLKRMKNAQS